jgi:cytosine/adenosine deaminase-related metal-dependent hydrolase
MRFLLRTENGGAVGVEGSRLVEPASPFDRVVDLGDGDLRPGLINAHDHLYRNHFPRLGSPPYPNAYDWAEDVKARWSEAIAPISVISRRDALLFGALKNLAAGVTTAVHHDQWQPEFCDNFPLHVAHIRVAHSLRFEKDLAARRRGNGAPRDAPFCIHLAEGIDAQSAVEVTEANRLGLFEEPLVPVHLVGVDEPGIALLRRAGVPFVWCPSSNFFLFERTAPRELVASGLPVLLGSDSLLTAAGTLLDELRVARTLGYLDDRALEDAVGATAAQNLGLAAPALDPGGAADLVFFSRPLFDARARDVALVLVDGVPRFGDQRFAQLFDLCGVPTDTLVVGGVEKLVVEPLGSVARRVCALSPECQRILD